MFTRRDFIKNGSITLGLGIGGGRMISEGYMSNNEQDDGEELSVLRDEVLLGGFAEGDISPEIGMERPGNYRKILHEKFHDPCKVRVAIFDDGDGIVCLVSVDTLVIPRSLVLRVRKRINKLTGIAEEAIMISATHSHSAGPLGMVQPGQYDGATEFVQRLAYEESSCANQDYIDFVERVLVETVKKAFDSRSDCKVGIGSGYEDRAGANRRFLMKGSVTYTYPGRGNPDIIRAAGSIDPEVGVIGVWNGKDECVCCLVNYARHANSAPHVISADWIYFMEGVVKGAMGEQCQVMLMSGAAGNVSHDKDDPYASLKGLDRPRYIGSMVGGEVVKVLMTLPRGTTIPTNFNSKTIKINRRIPSNEHVKLAYDRVKKESSAYWDAEWIFAKETILLDFLVKKEPVVDVEVQTIQIGPVVFASVPAEYFYEYGQRIKRNSAFEFTFPVSLANGCVGYVPTRESFLDVGGGYETRLTSYSNLIIEAGDIMADLAIQLISEFIPGKVPAFPEALPFNSSWSYGSLKPQLD